MASWQSHSYLSASNASYLEALYETYLKEPEQLSSQWKSYFDGLSATNSSADVSHRDLREQFFCAANFHHHSVEATSDVGQALKEAAVMQLINNYRSYGHHIADLDPLKLTRRHLMLNLAPGYHGLADDDLDTNFHASLALGFDRNTSLRQVILALKKIYCSNIGIEYMHITNATEVQWLQSRIESKRGLGQFSIEDKKQILSYLIAAEGLEKYLGNKYVGQKRFSLEGGESLIPAIRYLISQGQAQGVKECVIGMAHRGRLNMLVNVIGQSPQALFNEFEGKFIENNHRSGDVKYHLGFSSNIKTSHGIVHLALAFNPSHLEIVAPMVLGSVRARQNRRQDKKGLQVLPIIIHGDAAIAGQGVAMETFNLSQARGYYAGGSIHLIINNQIGFTTSNPLDARSTLYCTDIAKMVQAPVFHVNGDNPEAVCAAVQLAVDYRMRFHKDVVVDLVCYRRHGHNEADEPAATQPLMYHVIRHHPSTTKLYANQLIANDVMTTDEVTKLTDDYRSKLSNGDCMVAVVDKPPDVLYCVNWQPYIENTDLNVHVKTAVNLSQLKTLGQQLQVLPPNFKLQAQVAKMMAQRSKMAQGECAINWGYAETLAYATLLAEGYPIRLSGQDSGRGTFAHRHANLHDQNNGNIYTPLSHLPSNKASFICIDSILSEEAVMAFEYGYATATPNALVIWEAQFGDFANGAQVVIDQFLSSGEQKWNRYCGLVLFLPHGYEGMGPEHSSARLERYLQLCAQQNMSVCIPTTPAQIFHLLRRQMIRKVRKPLIVLTPKSLLRHQLAVSSLHELAKGKFEVVLPEIDALDVKQIKKIVLCTGKVYYDLLEKRRALKKTTIAILRLEQMYPFPRQALIAQLKRYTKAKSIVWCQEEPMNQGAWYQISFHLRACSADCGLELDYVGRFASAAPAAGSPKRHITEQQTLVITALA